MNRMIRAATVAALLTSGLGSIGCVHTGERKTLGDCYRNAVDPCYPDRYEFAARQSVVAPFAQQVVNGHVLNQTIWNYYFEFGTDKLTPAGLEKLNSITRTRPAPDPKLYIQTARDIPANIDPDKVSALRADLDTKRAAAIQQYMASQPAFEAVAYEIYVHDPVVPGINAEMVENAYRGSFFQYRGGVSGAGTGVLGTGGGGAGLTAPPVSGTGAGGAFNPAGGFGGPSGGGFSGPPR